MNPIAMLRYGFAILLVLAAVVIAWMLIRELTTTETNEGLTALLGALVGAISMAIKDVVKDLYDPDDDVGGNGKPPAPPRAG